MINYKMRHTRGAQTSRLLFKFNYQFIKKVAHHFVLIWFAFTGFACHVGSAPNFRPRATLALRPDEHQNLNHHHHPGPQELSLRQVLVPLMSTTNSNYQPKQSVNFSQNNRGGQPPSHPNESPVAKFGQRRISPGREDNDRQKKSLLLSEPGNKLASIWSQPDPRRSYSLPVGLIKVVKGRRGAARRVNEAARFAISGRHLTSLAPPSLVDNLSGQQQQQVNSSHQIEARESSGVELLESLNSLEVPANQMLADLAQRRRQVAPSGQQISPSASAAIKQHPKGKQMVTLIKYLPVLMSVPAEQLVSASYGPDQARPIKLVASQHQQQHQQQSQQQDESVNINNHQPIVTTTAHPSLEAGTQAHYGLYKQPAEVGQINKPAASGAALLRLQQAEPDYFHGAALISLASPATMQSAHTAPLPVGGELASSGTSAPPSHLHHLMPAHRVAYIPVSISGGGASGGPQSSATSSAFAGHQPTSKAITNYASRLISMLRPSSLLSSIGGSPGANQPGHAGASLAPTPQLIYLIAPSEVNQSFQSGPTSSPHSSTLISSSSSLSSPPPPPSQSQSDDLLSNQSNKIYSKQQREQSSAYKWPPHLDGLICVQGDLASVADTSSGRSYPAARPAAFANKPEQQQQQQQIPDTDWLDYSTTPTSAGSYEFEYNKVKGATNKTSGQSKGGQQAPEAKTRPAHAKKGAKTAYGGAKTYPKTSSTRKPSPVMLMHKISQKANYQRPPYNYDGNYTTQTTTTTTSSGYNNRMNADVQHVEDYEQEQPIQQKSMTSSPTDHQYLESDEEERRSQVMSPTGGNTNNSIIPFTIRDKIELPASMRSKHGRYSGRHEHPARYNSLPYNSPVQYDEPAESTRSSTDERRSRTTFADLSYESRHQGQSSPIDQIDYRKESASANRDYSTMPLLLASSSSSSSSASASSSARINSHSPPPAPRPEPSADFSTTTPATSSSQPMPSFLRPSVTFKGPEQPVSSGELITLPSNVDPSASSSPTTAPPSTQLDDNPNEPPGRLISSASMQSNELQAAPGGSRASPAERLASGPITPNPLGSAADPVVELVVNSTPEVVQATTLASAATTGAPPINNQTSSRHEENPSELLHSYEKDSNELPPPASSFVSHDKSLAAEASFGRISESLQTNPLDLIDLQNSRSNFELPAQLESLSMLMGQPRLSQVRPHLSVKTRSKLVASSGDLKV